METINWIALVSAIVSLVIGLYNGIPAFRKLRLDATTINIQSIEKLSAQVDELIEDKGKMNDRITWLENELRRYINGYSRALRFIQRHADVNVDIPNFLETDPELRPRGEKK